MAGTITTLTICRTCRPEGAAADAEPAGSVLVRAVARAATDAAAVEVRAIACQSACSRACSATVAAAGKFSYVIGNLVPEDAADLVAFAEAHAAAVDGVPPWRSRPERIRKNTIARVPPPGADHPLVERLEPAGDA
ncbi:DUF1636 domain-containing protein [Chelatococcus sambhunathii]|uniref:DUF1636 domain-containing protein n=1 Tax=Chelatococcus sambhunathii TaxID=363953 RepID=A0ABU1DE75_9HYPH|nr:DUF1636 domain-containing protein [Chelatococcus sambhunathii]MDR4306402.1 DUF1636 domain-containing protein [Chelatococcus sambhunathii]